MSEQRWVKKGLWAMPAHGRIVMDLTNKAGAALQAGACFHAVHLVGWGAEIERLQKLAKTDPEAYSKITLGELAGPPAPCPMHAGLQEARELQERRAAGTWPWAPPLERLEQ